MHQVFPRGIGVLRLVASLLAQDDKLGDCDDEIRAAIIPFYDPHFAGVAFNPFSSFFAESKSGLNCSTRKVKLRACST